jgi:mannose-6-phosphate isomerase-like protein (cupin superfamily)
MPRSFRRVVTGHNKDGRSIFIMDGPAPVVHTRGAGAASATEFWETRATPADNSGNDDPTLNQPQQRLPPPKHGSKFRMVEFPPDAERVAALRQPDVSHDAKAEGYVRDLRNARHPGFHKTDTIDYAIVLSGEIHALMDDGEVLLKSGDVLIQRGTSHAWSNRAGEPACVAFVLIDADPA